MTATNQLPTEGYCRLTQILGNPKAKPNPIPPLVPVSKSTWYDGVKSGRFPAPVYIGRSSLWKCADIRKLIERIEKGEFANEQG